MPAGNDRAVNLGLGLNLGWLQQGAAFGGRAVAEMTADLERVRGAAAAAGYTGYQGTVDRARSQLSSGQPPSSALDEVSTLIVLFQDQAQGAGAAALSLGIVLGWLQQGSRANNRPVAMTTADLESVRTHATNAGYTSFDGYIGNASTKLLGGQPVSSILLEVTALIGLFQGEG